MATQSDRVTHALMLVDSGISAYAAARHTGIALSTIYRALKRRERAADTVDAALDRLLRHRQHQR